MAPRQFPLNLLASPPTHSATLANASSPFPLGAALAALNPPPSCHLPLALGQTPEGVLVTLDLATMPHVLVGGEAGSGTSTVLRAMVASLLYVMPPAALDLVLIDAAGGEFACFGCLPHLRAPVISESRLGVNALGWAVDEMERRYARLQHAGARNIAQHNQRHAPLPYIVIVIAELAELMAAAAPDVEWALVRLAQMSRAVGIHLMLATHDTSVDVITGSVKANFPARLACRMAARAASRVLLDASGAESLSAPGDMLLLGPTTSKAVRLRGSFVSLSQARVVAGYLAQHGPRRERRTSITDPWTRPARSTDEEDALYDQAARLVVSTGDRSMVFLQRALRIGFSRAARLVDRMREEGL